MRTTTKRRSFFGSRKGGGRGSKESSTVDVTENDKDDGFEAIEHLIQTSGTMDAAGDADGTNKDRQNNAFWRSRGEGLSEKERKYMELIQFGVKSKSCMPFVMNLLEKRPEHPPHQPFEDKTAMGKPGGDDDHYEAIDPKSSRLTKNNRDQHERSKKKTTKTKRESDTDHFEVREPMDIRLARPDREKTKNKQRSDMVPSKTRVFSMGSHKPSEKKKKERSNTKVKQPTREKSSRNSRELPENRKTRSTECTLKSPGKETRRGFRKPPQKDNSLATFLRDHSLSCAHNKKLKNSQRELTTEEEEKKYLKNLIQKLLSDSNKHERSKIETNEGAVVQNINRKTTELSDRPFEKKIAQPRDLLAAFYEQFDPSQLSFLDEQLEEYKGRENELFERLSAKYSIEPKASSVKGSRYGNRGKDASSKPQERYNVEPKVSNLKVSRYSVSTEEASPKTQRRVTFKEQLTKTFDETPKGREENREDQLFEERDAYTEEEKSRDSREEDQLDAGSEAISHNVFKNFLLQEEIRRQKEQEDEYENSNSLQELDVSIFKDGLDPDLIKDIDYIFDGLSAEELANIENLVSNYAVRDDRDDGSRDSLASANDKYATNDHHGAVDNSYENLLNSGPSVSDENLWSGIDSYETRESETNVAEESDYWDKTRNNKPSPVSVASKKLEWNNQKLNEMLLSNGADRIVERYNNTELKQLMNRGGQFYSLGDDVSSANDTRQTRDELSTVNSMISHSTSRSGVTTNSDGVSSFDNSIVSSIHDNSIPSEHDTFLVQLGESLLGPLANANIPDTYLDHFEKMTSCQRRGPTKGP